MRSIRPLPMRPNGPLISTASTLPAIRVRILLGPVLLQKSGSLHIGGNGAGRNQQHPVTPYGQKSRTTVWPVILLSDWQGERKEIG
jgi:hypothetical protein